jgi:hypothetical protein
VAAAAVAAAEAVAAVVAEADFAAVAAPFLLRVELGVNQRLTLRKVT